MKTLSATFAIALLATSVAPALAWVDHPSDHREYHDIWGMTCYPENGVPFRVTTNANVPGVLIIYGAHGVSRLNNIESVKNIKNDFAVVANGFDYKGKHREIELIVSKGTSILGINRDSNNVIQCSGATGVAD